MSRSTFILEMPNPDSDRPYQNFEQKKLNLVVLTWSFQLFFLFRFSLEEFLLFLIFEVFFFDENVNYRDWSRRWKKDVDGKRALTALLFLLSQPHYYLTKLKTFDLKLLPPHTGHKQKCMNMETDATISTLKVDSSSPWLRY